MNDRIEYFLNALLFYLWRHNRTFMDGMNRCTVAALRKLGWEKAANKIENNWKESMEKTGFFLFDKKTGLFIGMSKGFLEMICFMIAVFAGTLLTVLVVRLFPVKALLLIGPACGFLGIAAARLYAIRDNRYLAYFEKFEAEDERWFRRWNIITWLAYLSIPVSFFLSILGYGYIYWHWDSYFM